MQHDPARRFPAEDDQSADETVRRKQAEEAQARLAAIVESSDDAIVGLTPDGVITTWNPGAERLYGYAAGEAIGHPLTLVLPPDAADDLPGVVAALTRGERVDHFETVHHGRDHRPIHVSVTVSGIRGPNGDLVGISTVTRDVTGRKWTDELLAGERRVLEMIARGQPLADALDVLTRTVEDLAGDGLHVSILLLDDDRTHLRHGAAPSLPDEYIRGIDGLEIGPDVGSCGSAAYHGEAVIVSDIAADPRWTAYPQFCDLALAHGLRACWSTPIVGSDGRVLGTFAMYYREPRTPSAEHRRLAALVGRTAAVIVERKRADEIGARLAAVVTASDDAIIGSTLDGVVTHWNPAAERLYGYAAAEMVGRSIGQIIPADRLDEFRDAMERVRQGTPVPAFDTVRLHRAGRPVEVSLSLAPIAEEAGAVAGVSAIARDIAGRRALERLQQEFLALVSHELRNPLTTIKGFAQILRERGAYSDQAVEMIAEQSDVLERLVNDLLDASRVQVDQLHLERGLVDLVALARANVEQARRQTTEHTISIEAPVRPLVGRWDRTRLGQVFANLLTNAI